MMDRKHMIEMGEKFYLEMYGKLGKKSHRDLSDHLCEIVYAMPKYIPISCMSETSMAFQFQILRAYLKVITCKNLEQRLC